MNDQRKKEMEKEKMVIARINKFAAAAVDVATLTRELSEPGVIEHLQQSGADNFVGLGHILEFLGDEIGTISYDCFVRRAGR